MARILRIWGSMNPLRALAALALFVAALFATSDARACGGAILLDLDAAAANLAEAESALDAGDLRFARTLAAEVLAGDEELFFDRAHRIEALSFARDPGASQADLERALMSLGEMMSSAERRTPSLEADFAETAARLPKYADDARHQLASLSDRDLMGSAYAYAAYARLADAHGDHRVAAEARARCTTMASDPGVCGAELRRPPLFRLHGAPLSYAATAAIAMLLLAYRGLRLRRARKRGMDATGPWIGYGARVQVAALVAAGGWAFARARSPFEVTVVMLAAALLTVWLERRLFLRAVRAGKIAGYALRPSVEDDTVAKVALHLGPRNGETLERVAEDAPDGGYREPARTSLLRTVRRPLRQTVGATLAFGVLLGMVAAVYAAVGATRAASVPYEQAPRPVTINDLRGG
jgi:hypothetical protein